MSFTRDELKRLALPLAIGLALIAAGVLLARGAGSALADAQRGLAAGFWGEVITTADGGATWQRERSPADVHLFAVTAAAGGSFLVGGARETILVGTPKGGVR